MAAASPSAAGMSDSVYRVDTTPRLAQWRIESLSSFTYRKSDPFKIGLWNWYLTLERNKNLFVKLYPEVSSATKEQPPIASFIIKIIFFPTPNRKIIVHPGISDKQLKNNNDFVWLIDTFFTGKFIIEVEFLDLKIVLPSGGEPSSIWSGNHLEKHSSFFALSSLSKMLTEHIHSDITINARNGSITAHRAVLAARSPVFQSMFSHNLQEKKLSTINIIDMSLDACQAFLSYIYGKFQADEFLAHRVALLKAADKYDISDLKEACHESLMEDIDLRNVLERLELAHLYGLAGLKSGCLRYLVYFGKIYEIDQDLNLFLQSADRDLIAEVFQDVLTAWKCF